VGFILDCSCEDAMSKDVWDGNTTIKIDLLEKAASMGKVTFIPLKMTSLGPANLLEKMTKVLSKENDLRKNLDWKKELSPEEVRQMEDLIVRLDKIMETSKKCKIPILLDGEQTFRQPAIDYFAVLESRKWNKEGIVVYNTYQMYLKRTMDNLVNHLSIAKKENFYLGVKMVRGAYIVSEKKRAIELNEESPILLHKSLTDVNYNRGLLILLTKMKANEKCGLVVATHNLRSVLEVGRFCFEEEMPLNHPNLHFAQLKGMADNLSVGLEFADFNVSKLIPYGPISDVLPYLKRRVQENRDVLGGTQFERELLWIELKKRNFGLKKW